MLVNIYGLTNILLVPKLEKDGYRITYDTLTEWQVHCSSGKTITFTLDTDTCEGMSYVNLNESEAAMAMVQTVRYNYEGYTKREVKEARRARNVQAMIVHPTDEDYHTMVSHNCLRNCPVKPVHITNEDAIYGPDLAGVHGKTLRTKPQLVQMEAVAIPSEFYVLH